MRKSHFQAQVRKCFQPVFITVIVTLQESVWERPKISIHCSARNTSRLGVMMQTGHTSTFAATSRKRTTVLFLPVLHHRAQLVTQDQTLWFSTIKLGLVGWKS